MPDNSPALTSFGEQINAVVIGATGGIGGAFAEALAGAPSSRVLACARRPQVLPEAANILAQPLDLEDEETIAAAAERARQEMGALQFVIVATGILHDDEELQPEKTWRHVSAEALERAFRINATGPALAAKHFLPLLDTERKSVFAALSARVGSIEDNRLGGWHAYRASKAALNMLIRTNAIELARRNPIALCVGLHPGTVDTGLSKPFQGNVPDAKLFTPEFAAGKLLGVLDTLTPAESGQLFAWDGSRIAF